MVKVVEWQRKLGVRIHSLQYLVLYFYILSSNSAKVTFAFILPGLVKYVPIKLTATFLFRNMVLNRCKKLLFALLETV